jgi:hypothetical protein
MVRVLAWMRIDLPARKTPLGGDPRQMWEQDGEGHQDRTASMITKAMITLPAATPQQASHEIRARRKIQPPLTDLRHESALKWRLIGRLCVPAASDGPLASVRPDGLICAQSAAQTWASWWAGTGTSYHREQPKAVI